MCTAIYNSTDQSLVWKAHDYESTAGVDTDSEGPLCKNCVWAPCYPIYHHSYVTHCILSPGQFFWAQYFSVVK